MKKVIGYTRVSTEDQAAHGVSLAAQAEKIRQYAALYDYELIGIEEDAGGSAKTLDRPGLQRALTTLSNGKAEGLLVAKLDRLTRSVKDLGSLIDAYFSDKRPHSLHSVADQIDTSTASGRLVLNVLMSVSQWEREAIGERTRDALQHMKAQGQRISGQLPYGYRMDPANAQMLIEDADEQRVLAAVREHRKAGLSLRAISARLQSDGMVNRRGRAFKVASIHAMAQAA